MENKDITSPWSDLLKEALKHSIAQWFLIFSAIFVIVALSKSGRFVPLSFFTLLYALMNFKLETIRKFQPLGNYGIRDNYGSILFTTASISLLFNWIIGIVILLSWKIFYIHKLLYFFSWIRIVWVALLIIFLASFFRWMILIFERKSKRNNSELKKDDNRPHYHIACLCQNCDLDRRVKIAEGIKVTDLICPECGIQQQLKRRRDEN